MDFCWWKIPMSDSIRFQIKLLTHPMISIRFYIFWSLNVYIRSQKIKIGNLCSYKVCPPPPAHNYFNPPYRYVLYGLIWAILDIVIINICKTWVLTQGRLVKSGHPFEQMATSGHPLVQMVKYGCPLIQMVKYGCPLILMVKYGCPLILMVKYGCPLIQMVKSGCPLIQMAKSDTPLLRWQNLSTPYTNGKIWIPLYTNCKIWLPPPQKKTPPLQ